MTLKHVALTTILSVALGIVPILSFAQTAAPPAATTDTPPPAVSPNYAFQRQGVFGCSQNGSYAMSVGALSAVGGTYVPVNDAAVTLNTGYLVYKECVLRGIVNRMREDATSALLKQTTIAYTTGRNGLPLYYRGASDSRLYYDNSIVRDLQGSTLGTLNPAFAAPTKRAILQGYMVARNAPNKNLACGYAGNINSVLSGRPPGSIWDAIDAQMNPACNPYYAYVLSNDLVMNNAASVWQDQLTQLGWGNGTYPRQITDADGNLITVTPGYLVGAGVQQALQTGFTQLQNANDIDQMVGALFAGITTQMISDNRGLAGLTQQTGSQPSYLDQVAKESSAGLRDSALNAAIQILAAAKQVETAYYTAMNDIGTLLVNTINQLKSKEQACWNLIIPAVCADNLKADNTCTAKAGACTTDPQTGQQTCPTGPTLKVATSTVFSQGVIAARITPLASSTALNIQASSKALGLIDQLLAGVTNTTSLTAQRIALQQLDGLVAQRALHTQYDAQNAQQTKTDVSGSMATLIQDTLTAWGDSTDPNVGWCNINNPSVIQMWINNWKK